MICNTLKQCIKQVHHLEPQKESGKKKGKKAQNKKNRGMDIYQQPLCQSPCRNKEQQNKCIEFLDRRSKITCIERGKSYTLDQSQRYPGYETVLIHIDGGVITNPEANDIYKCDYAIFIRDEIRKGDKCGTAVLVELKGRKIRHAIEQLMTTLHQTEFTDVWESQARVYGRVVCASVPRIRNSEDIMDAKEEFIRRGGNLVIREDSYVETYGELQGT